jgi:hypothetical protein
MNKIEKIQITVEAIPYDNDCMDFQVRATVLVGGRSLKVFSYRYGLLTDHFTSVWERLMERATHDINIAVREAERDNKRDSKPKEG